MRKVDGLVIPQKGAQALKLEDSSGAGECSHTVRRSVGIASLRQQQVDNGRRLGVLSDRNSVDAGWDCEI